MTSEPGPSRRRGLLVVALALVLVGGWRLYRVGAGQPAARLADRWHVSTRVLDRHGRLLRDVPSPRGGRGRPLALDQVGPRLLAATLAAEDQRFFEHAGVDGLAILRALGQNARHVRVVSGASTITQQLVKLLDGRGQPGPRTLAVKLRESARAQNLEQILGKQKILEAYLNRLDYGRGRTGPDAAARGYFGVAPHELSWARAAFLAVLPRAPSYLDPYRHPDRVRKRQRRLLGELREAGVLADEDYRRALDEPVEPRPLHHPWLAPHLVMALRAGGSWSGRARVLTTIDADLQRDVEGLVRAQIESLAGRRAHNAAVLVADAASGEVLAYVGNADYFDRAAAGAVDLVRSRRQPGSALKPFVYALAFERGRSATEPLADVPTRFGHPSGGYRPGNFDGIFRGPVSAREALAGSLNVPAVALAEQLGTAPLLRRLRRLGLESLDGDGATYGLSLALGSGEVTLWELTGAYAALARQGRSVRLRATATEQAGLGAAVRGEPVFDPAAVALVTESLSDPLARVRGLGGRLLADLGFPVAVKTGTSSGYRDGWCLGYTRERVVGVWVGNADGRPMAELTGGSAAGPLFSAVMRRAMAAVPQRRPLWDRELLMPVEVCPLSGEPPGPACPPPVTRWARPAAGADEPPASRCRLHRRARPLPPVGPSTSPRWRCDRAGPERIVLLDRSYRAWLAAQPPGAPGRDPEGLPWLSRDQVLGCGHARHGAAPTLRIDEPTAGSVIVLSRTAPASVQRLELRASLDGRPSSVREVEFLVDERVVARSRAPFRASATLPRGDHLLAVRPADPTVAVAPARIRFSVR